MIALPELEALIRRCIREELQAHEARRAAGETPPAPYDDVAEMAAGLAAGARRVRAKRGAR